MTEVTPTAAVAAPVAAPAVVPAAVAAPAAAPEISSLVPAEPGAAPVVAAVVPAKVDPNAPALIAPAEWFLSDGVKGAGVAPAWYKGDKYKSVAAQAEAYSHLEKKLGAFVGAPKDGRYEFKTPEGVQGEFDQEHPAYQGFVKIANELQISNEGFNTLMGAFAVYEAGIAPNPAVNIADAKKALGEGADARITATAQWVQANLGADIFNDFRVATNAAELNGEQIARVVKIVEAVVNKGRVTMPKAGVDVPNQNQDAEQQLKLMREKKGADGKPLYFSDPQHRAAIDKKRNEVMAAAGPV